MGEYVSVVRLNKPCTILCLFLFVHHQLPATNKNNSGVMDSLQKPRLETIWLFPPAFTALPFDVGSSHRHQAAHFFISALQDVVVCLSSRQTAVSWPLISCLKEPPHMVV
mmetsp:Transcript_602/g.1452  ORF Transcript_602/g.1452 Transcript_602/m.1452 type:complete len:110 (+) Transcript_602:219-548(+)